MTSLQITVDWKTSRISLFWAIMTVNKKRVRKLFVLPNRR